MSEGVNALAIEGGATTVRTAVLLVVPMPPSAEVTALVVLLFVPAVVPVTLRLTLQEPLAATLPTLRLRLPLPPTAPVTVPPQVLLRPVETETTSPAGNVSLNAIPLSADVFGLLIVKVSDVDPLSGTLVAPNVLVRLGGATTVMLAFEVLPVPPSVEVTCTELFFTPAVVP
jgi:hypothetical protein